MKERIVAAAIRRGIVTLSQLPPARHHHILHELSRLAGDPRACEQGFLTDTGRFVSREEARVLAEDVGQIIRKVGGDETRLYSENLW